MFAVSHGRVVFLLVLVVIVAVLGSGNPHAGFAVLHRLVLVGEIKAFLTAVLAALRKGSGTCWELSAHGSILRDPVGESVFAVLNDAVRSLVGDRFRTTYIDLRLAGLIAIIRVASLAGRDRGIINKFEQMLAEASNDSEFLAVFAKSIELVGKSSLELLAGNVWQLGFGDKRLGLSTDKFLFEDDNLRRVWLLVFQLSDVVSDFLLP
jgi:hypothetical protein